MTVTTHQHTFKRYDKELQKLRDQIARMGDLVSRQMDLLLNNFDVSDTANYEEVIEGDLSINGMEIKASKIIIRLLAKRAPVGVDLRLVIASSRMITDLERIGDEIVSMAKTLMAGEELGICDNQKVLQLLQTLTATAMNMLDRTLLAANNDDEAAARMLIEKYVGVTGSYIKDTEELVLCVQENYEDKQRTFHAALLINSLQRISRHISNICEHIVFYISGEDIRHAEGEGEVATQ